MATATAELNNRGSNDFGGMRCDSFFRVSRLSISDQQLSDATARVSVRFAVTALKDLQERAMANDVCYGSVSGGWSTGESAMSSTVYVFERWESGWRFSHKE